MPENAVMVFTGRPPSQLLDEEGSKSWALSARRARKCTYVVCVQNRETFEEFSPTEPHNQAFLVGKITEVSLSDEQPDPSENKPPRYIIKFHEYARVAVNVSKLRKGNRNPVGYIDIMAIGIDPDALDFVTNSNPRPLDPKGGGNIEIEDLPLTMSQAKKGLALTFGVSPDAVEITIRG